jgi:hypothetical protein
MTLLPNSIDDFATPGRAGVEFFRDLVLELVTKVMKTSDDLVLDAYKNPADPTAGDPKCLALLKKAPSVDIKTAMKFLGIVRHPNNCCQQIVHVPVLQQFRGTLCGFHALFNAKNMAKALITDNRFTQLLNLC